MVLILNIELPNPLRTSFPIAAPKQVRNKSVTSLLCLLCHMSFPKFHYNDLLPNYCGLVSDILTCQDSLLCRQQVHNKLAIPASTGKLRGNESDEFWALCECNLDYASVTSIIHSRLVVTYLFQ